MILKFIATIPPLASAFSIDGEDGAGGRIKLDIPGTDAAAIDELRKHARGKVLQVTVEVIDN